MLKVGYLTNAAFESGVGHQAEEIAKRLAGKVEIVQFNIDGVKGELRKNGAVIARVRPWKIKTFNWIRLAKFLPNDEKIDLWHATNQTLSFTLPRTGKTLVTVHDIIELTNPQSVSGSWLRNYLFFRLTRYLYSGIQRAAQIIAVSNYTKQVLADHLSIAPDKISVIHNAVSTHFYPIEKFEQTIGYQALRRDLQLEESALVVLCVGSEHPRKNVATALKAFAKLKQQVPQAIFVKVGSPGLVAGREAMLEEMDRLGIRDSVRLMSDVSYERLNELYNLADVFIFPSRLEGFGLPPLQAMAVGTPVVAANINSISEVLDAAALLHDPDDVAGFAKSLLRVLTEADLSASLREQGLARAKQFSWDRAAQETFNVYQSLV